MPHGAPILIPVSQQEAKRSEMGECNFDAPLFTAAGEHEAKVRLVVPIADVVDIQAG